MTDITTNGHDTTGGLAPPAAPERVIKDPTAASRSKRYRDNRKVAVTAPAAQPDTRSAEKPNGFKGRVTVADRHSVTIGKAHKSNGVTPSVQPPWQAGNVVAYGAAICLAIIGIGLSAIGMVETATYSLAVGGFLFCALAIAADVLTLAMPATVGALWRKRSPAVALAMVLWASAAAVTLANLAGYVGEHVEQYQNGRQTMATGRTMAMERLARLRDERKAIGETRPPGAIAAALNDARRSERPALREALALAKRRDALDVDLATFEQRLGEIPAVATADASATVLSNISGMAISESELRRLRLALLLCLPLCGGLVLSLAFALAAASTRRIATA
jgi:hypothetical protein